MRYLLTAVALLTLSLTFAVSATASVGRFDPTAKIVQGGSSVKVSGPFSLDSDEVGYTIHATVVQGGEQAAGDSAYLTGGPWSATLTGGSFHAGYANAKATATVYLPDGSTEAYTWTQRITLR
jgi:hypothetical protein